jgi:hypothetical protein
MKSAAYDLAIYKSLKAKQYYIESSFFDTKQNHDKNE